MGQAEFSVQVGKECLAMVTDPSIETAIPLTMPIRLMPQCQTELLSPNARFHPHTLCHEK